MKDYAVLFCFILRLLLVMPLTLVGALGLVEALGGNQTGAQGYEVSSTKI